MLPWQDKKLTYLLLESSLSCVHNAKKGKRIRKGIFTVIKRRKEVLIVTLRSLSVKLKPDYLFIYLFISEIKTPVLYLEYTHRHIHI